MIQPIRRTLAGAALAGVVLLGGVACGGSDAPAAAPAVVPASQAVANPTSVALPRLGISSSLIPTAVDAQGGFIIPPQAEQASWFSPGPEPGQNGRSMVLGHVNLDGAQGVFSRLREARQGDVVEIGQPDGPPRRFVVDRVAEQSKAEWKRADMYRPLDHPEVALITCGGDLDRDPVTGEGTYESNVIVYARQQG